jgi:hypothetical protein
MHNWETHGTPYDFPFTMYCDNPDNSVYNHFSRRPFGLLVINCEGIVMARADWANQFITFEQAYLESLRTSEYQTCELEEEEETVSISGYEEESFEIYPNPTSGNFRLSGMEGNGRIQIFEPSGRLAFDSGIRSLSSEFVPQNLAGGYYIVHVESESGKTIQIPLIVE